MKKALILAIAGLLVFGMVLTASATSCDYLYNPSDIKLENWYSSGASTTWYLSDLKNSENQCFTGCPEGYFLEKAELTIYLKKSYDSPTFTLKVDGTAVATNVSIPNSTYQPFGPYDVLAKIEDLSATFRLENTKTWSSFYFDKACLNVECAPVPLPGAVLLLGAGMVRLVAYARRRRD